MTLNERIGYELRSQRLLRRMTIQQIANRLGKSKNTVSYYELGKIKITINDLIDYCNVVGCDYIEVLKKANDEWDNTIHQDIKEQEHII